MIVKNKTDWKTRGLEISTQSRKAFSIVEILLILAIVSLLVSIILVNFGTIKHRAQRSAVLTESANALRAIESCGVDDDRMSCNGTDGNSDSGIECRGLATHVPTPGTALCVDTEPLINQYSQEVWPDAVRNGYKYSAYAGSDAGGGRYVFALYRDSNGDNLPDSDLGICCLNSGCRLVNEPVGNTPGQLCHSLSGI